MSFGYATKRNTGLAKLSSGSRAATTPWIRNPSWTALPSVSSGDNKFVGLHRVDTDSNFLALSAAGNYTVDWGDGSATENINTGVAAQHQYTFTDAGLNGTNAPVTLTDTGDLVSRTAHGYSNGYTVRFYNIVSTTGLSEAQVYYVISATADTFQVSATQGGSAVALTTDGTATLLPYKLAVVTVTPQAGQTFTTINLHRKHTQSGLNAYSSGFLDIVIAGSSLTSILIGVQTAGATTQTISFSLLEQVSILSSDITSASYLFYQCRNLANVVAFSCSIVSSVNFTSMFQNCFSLTSVPLFNTAAVTNMSSMFTNCYSLTTVPLFNTAAVTNNMASMFSGCSALTSVPLFNTAAVTSMSAMFQNCFSLTSVPLFNTAAVTNMQSMFSMSNIANSLTSVPLLNAAAATSLLTMFNNCNNLSKATLSGPRYALSYTTTKVSETEITSIMDNLGTSNTQGLAFNITFNWGAVTPVSLTCTPTAGSTTITAASTTGVEVGMQWTGVGSPATTAIACTFTDTGDLVTKTAHGLSNGDEVSFATIVTTTGISINKIYFVVGAATDTFQVALTSGGAAVALTTNGTGTVRWRSVVTAVTPNTSITVSRPATATGSTALAFRTLKTQTALLKGWAVSG